MSCLRSLLSLLLTLDTVLAVKLGLSSLTLLGTHDKLVVVSPQTLLSRSRGHRHCRIERRAGLEHAIDEM
jgi:hypothetical protein